MEVVSGAPVTEVARRYGVSHQAVHGWLGRYERDGLAGLAGHSQRPISRPASGFAARTASASCSPSRTRRPPSGKMKRWHQTLQTDCLSQAGPFTTIEAAQAAVDAWRREDNHDRPHQAPDMATPPSRFRPSPPEAGEALSLWMPADLEPLTSRARTAPRGHRHRAA